MRKCKSSLRSSFSIEFPQIKKRKKKKLAFSIPHPDWFSHCYNILKEGEIHQGSSAWLRWLTWWQTGKRVNNRMAHDLCVYWHALLSLSLRLSLTLSDLYRMKIDIITRPECPLHSPAGLNSIRISLLFKTRNLLSIDPKKLRMDNQTGRISSEKNLPQKSRSFKFFTFFSIGMKYLWPLTFLEFIFPAFVLSKVFFFFFCFNFLFYFGSTQNCEKLKKFSFPSDKSG